MELADQLKKLKAKAMKKIGEAAAEHNTSRIRTLSGLANRIEEDQRALSEIEERANAYVAELSESTSASPSSSTFKDIIEDISKTVRKTSRHGKGKDARKMFVDSGPRLGFHLTPTGGRLYQTTSGNKVGIAFANEQKPDRWFLDLKNEDYDVVVLLCKRGTGEMLDFVLPHEMLKKIWASLSRHADSVKFNIIRDGDNYYLLVPPQRRESISRFLGNYVTLKD